MQSFKGYEDQASGCTKKKKQVTIIAISSVILVAMVVAVTVGVSQNHSSGSSADSSGDSTQIQTSMKAIQKICQPTDYQEACVSSLSSVANNTADTKDLVKLTFKVAIDQIKNAFNHSEVLQAAAKDRRTQHALQNCNELMEYAINDIENSMSKVGPFDFSKLDEIVEDIKIWLSAAVSYQETCLDGFENTTGNAAASMREVMKGASELTSNVLAIVTDVASVVTSLKIPFLNGNRRLLSQTEEFPSWVSAGKRRLLHTTASDIKADVVVAKDGTGDCTTVNEALLKIPKNSNNTFVIYVKEGIYEEMVQINRSMSNLMMIGDGKTKSVITGSANFIDGTPTFKTATVAVIGDGFICKDMGFVNTAGAAKHQAVALRVQSDMSIFYNCQMDGYQDTLYVHTKRQFYRECTISGTIDFIFGDSAAVFQNCIMVVRKPLDNQQNIVTAQGRKERREPTALILHNCTITADPELYPLRNKLKTYLGRPWKAYSRTFFIQCQLDDLIQPEGWLPWNADFALNTCFYAEYDNRGAGSSLEKRVKWRGIKTLTAERAKKFTIANFLRGNSWIKASGVPFYPGLLPLAATGTGASAEAGVEVTNGAGGAVYSVGAGFSLTNTP